MVARSLSPWILSALFTSILPVDAALYYPPAQVDLVSPATLVPASTINRLPVAAPLVIPPKKVDTDSYSFSASAPSILILDTATGLTLYAKNPDDPRPIGSITKLLTALVYLDTNPHLDASVMLREEDRVYGATWYVPFGVGVEAGDVLSAALIGSDNSSAAALARLSGLSPEDFLSRMNAKAGELGMTKSFFADATGLSSQNVASARDVSRLLRAALNSPEIAARIGQPQAVFAVATGESVTVPSTNTLLGTEVGDGGYIVGGKTGYIQEAGYCLTSRVARGKEGMDIVVLGSSTREGRFTDLNAAASWAHHTFRWPSYE